MEKISPRGLKILYISQHFIQCIQIVNAFPSNIIMIQTQNYKKNIPFIIYCIYSSLSIFIFNPNEYTPCAHSVNLPIIKLFIVICTSKNRIIDFKPGKHKYKALNLFYGLRNEVDCTIHLCINVELNLIYNKVMCGME